MVGIRNWLVKPGCWNYFKLITANWSSFTLQNSATVRKVTPKLLLWLSILTARPAKLQLKNGEWCCTWSCNFFTSSTFSRTAIYWTALKTFTRKGSLFSVVIFEDWTPTHTFMLCMCLHKHLSKAIFISQQNTPVSWPVHTPWVWPQKGQVHSQSPHFFKVLTTIPDEFQEGEREDWLWPHLKITHLEEKQANTWRKKKKKRLQDLITLRSLWTPTSRKTKDYSQKVRIMLWCFSESIQLAGCGGEAPGGSSPDFGNQNSREANDDASRDWDVETSEVELPHYRMLNSELSRRNR